MELRPLGRTGLTISALSLGTVSLGIEYGIAGGDGAGPPREAEAVSIVRAALYRGITLVDTAPAYGRAERIVGLAAGGDPRAVIATKVAAGSDPARSIEASRRALERNVIDVVQIHNASRAEIERGDTTRALVAARERGLVRVLGATVYDADSARAVLAVGEFGVLQVACSLLDQRMLAEVIPAAAAAGVGVVVRSVLLKGALTARAPRLPAPLAALVTAAAKARDELAGGSWDALPRIAIRYALSAAGVSSVLAGVKTMSELETAVGAEAEGPLDAAAMTRAAALAIGDDELLNPARWPSVP